LIYAKCLLATRTTRAQGKRHGRCWGAWGEVLCEVWNDTSHIWVMGRPWEVQYPGILMSDRRGDCMIQRAVRVRVSDGLWNYNRFRWLEMRMTSVSTATIPSVRFLDDDDLRGGRWILGTWYDLWNGWLWMGIIPVESYSYCCNSTPEAPTEERVSGWFTIFVVRDAPLHYRTHWQYHRWGWQVWHWYGSVRNITSGSEHCVCMLPDANKVIPNQPT